YRRGPGARRGAVCAVLRGSSGGPRISLRRGRRLVVARVRAVVCRVGESPFRPLRANHVPPSGRSNPPGPIRHRGCGRNEVRQHRCRPRCAAGLDGLHVRLRTTLPPLEFVLPLSHNQNACKWDPRRGSRSSELVRSGSRSGRRKRRKASNDPFCDRSQRDIARPRRSNDEDRDVRVQLQSENPPTVHEERDLARTFHAKRRAHCLDRSDQRGGHHGQDLEGDLVPSPSGEQPPGPGKKDDGLERVVRLDQRCQVNRSRRRAGHLRIPRLVSAQEAKRSKDRLSVVQIMALLRPVKDRPETTSGTPKEFNAAPRRCLSPWSLRAKVPAGRGPRQANGPRFPDQESAGTGRFMPDAAPRAGSKVPSALDLLMAKRGRRRRVARALAPTLLALAVLLLAPMSGARTPLLSARFAAHAPSHGFGGESVAVSFGPGGLAGGAAHLGDATICPRGDPDGGGTCVVVRRVVSGGSLATGASQPTPQGRVYASASFGGADFVSSSAADAIPRAASAQGEGSAASAPNGAFFDYVVIILMENHAI